MATYRGFLDHMQQASALHLVEAGRLLVVDIENFAGTSPRNLDADGIRRLASALRAELRPRAGDRVILACNPGWRLALRSAWSDAELLVRGGPDGADLALLERAAQLDLARFSEVWIASGDNRFSKLAADARRAGRHIVVVSRRQSLSSRLRELADAIHTFRMPRQARPQQTKRRDEQWNSTRSNKATSTTSTLPRRLVSFDAS